MELIETSVVEAVAAVDVHVVRHGAEAVRGVEVAVAVEVLEAAPLPFAFVGEEDAAQIVIVGAPPCVSSPNRPARTMLSTIISL